VKAIAELLKVNELLQRIYAAVSVILLTTLSISWCCGFNISTDRLMQLDGTGSKADWRILNEWAQGLAVGCRRCRHPDTA